MDRRGTSWPGSTGLSGGRLRVGTFMTAGIHLLPPALTAFRRAHPDVELTVTELRAARRGSRRWRRGEVDLALTHAYEPADAACRCRRA